MIPSGIASTIASTIAARRELDGRRHPLGNRRRHRLVRAKRLPEIAAHEPFQETAVLHDERTIEPELDPQLRHVRGRRAFAKHGLDGIARDEMNQREHQRRDAEHDRDGQEQATNQETQQWSVSRQSRVVNAFVVYQPPSARRPPGRKHQDPVQSRALSRSHRPLT